MNKTKKKRIKYKIQANVGCKLEKGAPNLPMNITVVGKALKFEKFMIIFTKI